MCNGYHSSLENCTFGCVGSNPTEDGLLKKNKKIIIRKMIYNFAHLM